MFVYNILFLPYKCNTYPPTLGKICPVSVEVVCEQHLVVEDFCGY
uniref:Uncharacterized protein n=1 Tax=Anguilla anguilla TaxID=7936 RepID=A0A0E9QUY6_ANGAN